MKTLRHFQLGDVMKLRDYLIIGGVLFIVLALFIWVTYFGQKSGSIANVYQDNDIVIKVDFTTNTYDIYPQAVNADYPMITEPVADEPGDIAFIILGSHIHEGERTKVYIEIDWDKKAIRIQKDETPKQIGVRRNWYDGTGLPAVSLPSKVFIVFETTVDDGVDGVV